MVPFWRLLAFLFTMLFSMVAGAWFAEEVPANLAPNFLKTTWSIGCIYIGLRVLFGAFEEGPSESAQADCQPKDYPPPLSADELR